MCITLHSKVPSLPSLWFSEAVPLPHCWWDRTGLCVTLRQYGKHVGFRVQGSGFRVQGSGFRVQGSGFRVQGSGFRVQSSGFRVQGLGVRVRF
jgi:hypothetical protein